MTLRAVTDDQISSTPLDLRETLSESVERVVGPAAVATVRPGLVNHFRNAVGLSRERPELVVPGMWSLAEASTEIATEVEAGDLADTGEPDSTLDTPWHALDGGDGVILLGPTRDQFQVALTDSPEDALTLAFTEASRKISLHFEDDRGISPLAAFPRPHDEQVWFDGTCLAGDGSVVGPILERLRSGVTRTIRLPTAAAGFLVGRIVRILGRPLRESSDPTVGMRLRAQERKHPDIAGLVRTDPRRAGRARAVVFVHGTFSTSFAMTVPLLANAPNLDAKLYRFEHDTFLPVVRNGMELEQFLGSIGSSELLVIAHSRGGLVAYTALERLDQQGLLPKHCRLYTFGTPFQGTPLAAAGGRGYRALLSAGTAVAAGLTDRITDLMRLAMTRLLPRRVNGIENMAPQSEFLLGLPIAPQRWDWVQTWGGNAALNPGLQTSPAVANFAKALFPGQDNDHVVATAASHPPKLGPGRIMPTDHFRYFADQQVAQGLLHFTATGQFL